MQLLKIYKTYKAKKITLEEAAAQLGISKLSLQIFEASWKSKLPTLFRTLEGINKQTISRAEASEILGKNPRLINHYMQLFGIRRPIGPRKVQQVVAEISRDLKTKFAIDWMAGGITIEEASELSNCTTRTTRRYCAELLNTHLGVTYKEFKAFNPVKQRQLADELDRLEGLEYDKKLKLDEIAITRQDLKQEALARLEALRTRARRSKNVRRR